MGDINNKGKLWVVAERSLTSLEVLIIFRETNDVPDWGLVKLSSVLLANGRERESEELLKKHYEETGGQHRFGKFLPSRPNGKMVLPHLKGNMGVGRIYMEHRH